MGRLFVVATPIGNLEDITIRAIKTIAEAAVVVCEDTRRTGQLVKILEERFSSLMMDTIFVPKRYVSVRDWNEAASVSKVLAELAVSDVTLISDAGTPLISDPGFKVVRAAREAGFGVCPIPGPSAVTAALSGAGLPTNRFVFWGFWNKKYKLIDEATNVIYESPVRISETLKMISQGYPLAKIVIAWELTKVHEKFEDYTGQELTTKGEATILAYLPRS